MSDLHNPFVGTGRGQLYATDDRPAFDRAEAAYHAVMGEAAGAPAFTTSARHPDGAYVLRDARRRFLAAVDDDGTVRDAVGGRIIGRPAT